MLRDPLPKVLLPMAGCVQPPSLLERMLKSSDVHTSNGGAHKILETLRVMQEQGKEKLMVVTDFDMTLTHHYANGSPGCTSFSVIETSNFMPETYRMEVNAARKKYAPKEADLTLSEEERRSFMEQWYSRAHELLIEHKVKKENLRKIVQVGNIKLRDGCDTMFNLLDSEGVPLVILSAGVADTLIITIEEQSAMRDNMSVISNEFVFDKTGAATGFADAMINSLNKRDQRDRFSSLSGKLKGRSNVILLGDSLGDPQMLQGMESEPANLIKVGFLNHDVERLLETYLGLYDIVLIGDKDMSPINQILQFVLQT